MNVVQLTYKSTSDPDTGRPTVSAVAAPIDKPDSVVAFGDLNLMRDWLERNGFRWMVGSQGVWVRS